MRIIQKGKILLLFLVVFVLFTACNNKNEATLTDGKEVLGLVKNEQSEETNISKNGHLAVILNIDHANNKIIIYEIETKDKKILTFSGSTNVLSKYNKELSMTQVTVGEIVEAEYKKGTQKLTKLSIAKDAWEYTGISDINIKPEKSIIKVGKNNYYYDESIQIFSNQFTIALNEIHKVDELTIRGVGKTIYSIDVVKGHGYVKLLNADSFEGGIIEIGTKNINIISTDMIIVAQEGDYVLTATKNGVGGSQNISITRNEELLVDISKFQEQAVRMGSIKFTIEPEGATLYVDGIKTSYKDLVNLSYGTHTLKIILEGYTTYNEKITINSIYINKEIVLEESEVSQEQETTTSTNYQIHVNTPSGASVYFDGSYKGIAPVSFSKEGGTHTIVLSKTGYENKTYTVYIKEDSEDAEFSFPDLTVSDD